MKLLIVRKSIREYKPAHTASGQTEWEVYWTIATEQGCHIGWAHFWGLTETQARTIHETTEVETK